MVRKSALLAGLIAASVAWPATAGPVIGFRLPPGGVRPVEHAFDIRAASEQMFQWKYQRDWQNYEAFANSYSSALEFAECASRYGADKDELLLRAAGSVDDRDSLVRLAERNRACVVEAGVVAPILLRAALAETMIERQGTVRSDEPVSEPLTLGIPEVVDGYPIAAISRCQVHAAPELVHSVLQSKPGSAGERAAVMRLYSSVPQCGLSAPGRLTATAARLGLVDAAFRRTPPPWR